MRFPIDHARRQRFRDATQELNAKMQAELASCPDCAGTGIHRLGGGAFKICACFAGTMFKSTSDAHIAMMEADQEATCSAILPGPRSSS